jgi:hypothetical protein
MVNVCTSRSSQRWNGVSVVLSDSSVIFACGLFLFFPIFDLIDFSFSSENNPFEEGPAVLIPFYSISTLERRAVILRVLVVLFAWFSKNGCVK